MVVLDTNIIIDHLRQRSDDTVLLKIARRIAKENLAISVISVQELYEGKSAADKTKEEYLLATISPLKILPYTYEAAQVAGEIARELVRPIEFADAAIAATAIINNTQLATLNKRDFQTVKDLEFYNLNGF